MASWKKLSRIINQWRVNMRNIKLVIEYDGRKFNRMAETAK